MSFIGREQRSMLAAKKSQNTIEAAEKAQREATEIEDFCQPESLQSIIEVLQNWVNYYINTLGMTVLTEVTATVPYIGYHASLSDRCRLALFMAIKQYEETTVSVEIDTKHVGYDEGEGYRTLITAHFSKSLI